MRSQKGFTLIELLVVIAIIALLLSILLPSLKTAKAVAKRVVCSTNLKSSGAGFYTYAADNNDELPISFYAMPRKDGSGEMLYKNMDSPWRAFRVMEVDPSAPSDAQYPDYILRWTSDPGGWKLNGKKRIWGYGSLYESGIIENAETFYCNASKRSDLSSFKYETYADGHSWPWRNNKADSDDLKKNVLVSYYYLPQAQKRKMTMNGEGLSMKVPTMAIKAASLNANNVLSVDMMAKGFFTHKIGKKRGVNALFGDGSVSYSFNKEVFDLPFWEEKNINLYPTAFRAVIKGIEGNASYIKSASF